MPRTPRRFELSENICYHVINRGHNRETVFRDDADRLAFLKRLGEYKTRFQFQLFHSCLRDNHFHLVLRPHAPRDLPRLMAGLLRSYVHYYHKRYRFVGHLWQGRFKSPAVQADPYLLSCGRYVERNSVAARLVKSPWDYRWSSCRAVALGEADALVDENPLIAEWSAKPDRRQEMWREFLIAEDENEEAVSRGGAVVGDPAFRGQLRDVHGRPQANGRGRPRTESNPNGGILM